MKKLNVKDAKKTLLSNFAHAVSAANTFWATSEAPPEVVKRNTVAMAPIHEAARRGEVPECVNTALLAIGLLNLNSAKTEILQTSLPQLPKLFEGGTFSREDQRAGIEQMVQLYEIVNELEVTFIMNARATLQI